VTTRIPLPAGTVVAFYTDGLVERRGESIDRGLERLREAIRPGHPDRVARDVMRHLIGGTVPRDDIALVVMRRTATPTQG
jgi:serine phosphatase RsbU (regulator of sigma subunit)